MLSLPSLPGPLPPHVPFEWPSLFSRSSGKIVTELPVLLAWGVGWDILERMSSVCLTKTNASDTPIPGFSRPAPRSRLFVLKAGTNQASLVGHVDEDSDFFSNVWFGNFIWVPSPLWFQLEEIVLEWGQWFLFFLIYFLLLFFCSDGADVWMLSGRRNGAKERMKILRQ